MMNILGITQGTWSNLHLTAAAVIPSLILLLVDRYVDRSRAAREKRVAEIPAWSKDIAANKEILRRLGAIKTRLGAERAKLFVNHNGVADGAGNHLKRFSLHSIVKDSHITFNAQEYVNMSCSIHNGFFEELLKSGGIEIRDTAAGATELSRMYHELGVLSLYAYPIIFDNIFWGFVSCTNRDTAANTGAVDRDSIQANINLIINAIKTIDNGKAKR